MSTDPNKAIRIAQAQLVLVTTLAQATVDAARARDQARAEGVAEALARWEATR